MIIYELHFKNYLEDEVLETRIALLRMENVRQVLEWYGAFYAGDDYTVTLNGRPLALDPNGEIEPIILEGD